MKQKLIKSVGKKITVFGKSQNGYFGFEGKLERIDWARKGIVIYVNNVVPKKSFYEAPNKYICEYKEQTNAD